MYKKILLQSKSVATIVQNYLYLDCLRLFFVHIECSGKSTNLIAIKIDNQFQNNKKKIDNQVESLMREPFLLYTHTTQGAFYLQARGITLHT